MNPADLPIRVRLEWPAGIVQTGWAKKPNVQEFERDGKQYVAVTAELDPPFDHLAHAQAAIDHLDTQETTMNAEYTADDFKNANIATRGTHDVARRVDPGSTLPWTYGDSEWEDDQGMAEHGWKPVTEEVSGVFARESKIKELNAIIDHLQDELSLAASRVTDAEEYAAQYDTISLDTLREAWEHAEVPTEDTPIREGDVLIFPLFAGYCVRPSWGDSPLPEARVLRRAPQPKSEEEKLQEKLEKWVGGLLTERLSPHVMRDLAGYLTAMHGARVTDGDES